jgi:hypothetical protein
VIQIHQTINGAAETSATASAALALPDAWSAAQLWINSSVTAVAGFNKFMNVAVLRGVQSLTTMRREAGVW